MSHCANLIGRCEMNENRLKPYANFDKKKTFVDNFQHRKDLFRDLLRFQPE